MMLSVTRLGLVPFDEAWEHQETLAHGVAEGRQSQTLILLEHPHVITIGTGGDDKHVLLPEEELRRRGISVHRINRGGDVTYHGPGQLIGYPILNLASGEGVVTKDVHLYLRNLEEVLIRTLRHWGLAGERVEKLTGVWVEGEKIAAIGVGVRKWVTMHGFALNVNTDLTYFDLIVPCGIRDRSVTSMVKLLGHEVTMEKVEHVLVNEFAQVFGFRPETS